MASLELKSYPTIAALLEYMGVKRSEEYSAADWEKSMRESLGDLGIWGFVDDAKALHYWMAPDCPELNRMEFLGHEIAHLMGIEDEQQAQLAGVITRMAYLALGMLPSEKDGYPDLSVFPASEPASVILE